MNNRRLPTYFISHGGGPWTFMPDQVTSRYATLHRALADMPAQIGSKPKAILIISGHWEEGAYTVMSSAQPPMLYDYYGFPEFTYHVSYPAPGDPQLAERVVAMLREAGLPAASDAQRGFDHGTFTPMKAIYPDADVPIVQLSMRIGYDPAEHLAVGRVLAPLRDEGVLIVGSGLSFHNLRLFGPASQRPSLEFDQWLEQTLVGTSPAARSDRLEHWDQAPFARVVHAREDHLIPLLVATGAAGDDPAVRIYHEHNFLGYTTVSSYRFDAPAP